MCECHQYASDLWYPASVLHVGIYRTLYSRLPVCQSLHLFGDLNFPVFTECLDGRLRIACVDHYCTIYYDAIGSWASYRGSAIDVKHEIKSDFEHLRKLPYSDTETGKLRLSWVSIKFAIHQYIVCLYLQTCCTLLAPRSWIYQYRFLLISCFYHNLHYFGDIMC